MGELVRQRGARDVRHDGSPSCFLGPGKPCDLNRTQCVQEGGGPPPRELVRQVVYATSGALWNLSRHPDNAFAMYRLELQVKAKRYVGWYGGGWSAVGG